jgi:thioredoxin 1
MAKNILIVGLVVLVVVSIAWLKARRSSADVSTHAQTTAGTTASAASTEGLPRLVELGAGKCTACKQMKPVIEDLRKEFAGQLEVESIDVIAQAGEARAYNWHLIPCQVFLDPAGKELWRHEGFLSKADILAKWKELGVTLNAAPTRAGT